MKHADALIRICDRDKAEPGSPPTAFETCQPHRLETILDDGKREWAMADSSCKAAAGLTTTPAAVFNTWEYSRLTRGDFNGAGRLFVNAPTCAPRLSTARNTPVRVRDVQRKYELPVIRMTLTGHARPYHMPVLTAQAQG
ncbi:hypothetical protein [Rhodovulum sp. YEN HP10]|uniref:hypothetical protein n=1 Tax=Rhodovulum sp. HP10 TaxID=3387397 RepID=UPI0039DF48B2